jgi:glycosyltransferase involved in cell wall biosynthesis
MDGTRSRDEDERVVVHVISEFSAREAMGRTVLETARRVRGRHHLVTSAAHDTHDAFAEVHEVGGPMLTFPLQVREPVATLLARLRPDVVHLHAGALGPMLALATDLRHHPLVTTLYAWPSLPRPGAWRRASLTEMRQSNVLQARVLATTVLPPALVREALRRSGTSAVLSPDPRVLRRLGTSLGTAPVERLPSGAPRDPRRAERVEDAPVVVFAGRAETVRGVDTLLEAFPRVLAAVPGARLRLLLIPRPELDAILSRTDAAGMGASVEVVTTPVPDLLAELAAAQVGAWPFKFDYVTSPPAMAVAEALSVGLPVVSTDVACVRAVVRADVDGLIVPPADPRALAAGIVRLLRDEPTWARLAAAGPLAMAERFGWDRMADVTERAYERAGADPRS